MECSFEGGRLLILNSLSLITTANIHGAKLLCTHTWIISLNLHFSNVEYSDKAGFGAMEEVKQKNQTFPLPI